MKKCWASSIISLTLPLSACTSDPTIAEEAGQQLLASEVAAVVPAELAGQDSADFAQQYVENWRREVLLAAHARSLLPDVSEKIRARMQAQARRLMISEMQQHLLASQQFRIDDQEILHYYQQHIDAYRASNVLFLYTYIHSPDPLPPDVLALLCSQAVADHIRLREWCSIHKAEMELPSALATATQLRRIGEQTGWTDLDRLSSQHGPLYKSSYAPAGMRYHAFGIRLRLAPGERLPLAMVRAKIKRNLLDIKARDFIRAYEKKILEDAQL
ncbi:MAG: hypothetical protein LW884_07830 [Bacteroidetes bacterium]|jgi:hypothetical protein|nr:hypothetical protein [Bacteroidota bacterium]